MQGVGTTATATRRPGSSVNVHFFVTDPWLWAIWSMGRYHFSDGVADQCMMIAVLVANIWHTHGEYRSPGFGRKLSSMRVDASAVRPLAIPELFWPPVEMRLELMPEQILSPCHVICRQVIPIANGHFVSTVWNRHIFEHRIQMLVFVYSLVDWKVKRWQILFAQCRVVQKDSRGDHSIGFANFARGL